MGNIVQSCCHLPDVAMEVIGAVVVSGCNLLDMAEAMCAPLLLVEFMSILTNTGTPFVYSCPSRHTLLYSCVIYTNLNGSVTHPGMFSLANHPTALSVHQLQHCFSNFSKSEH